MLDNSPSLLSILSFHPLRPQLHVVRSLDSGQGHGWAVHAGLAVLGVGGKVGGLGPSLHGSERPGALNAELTAPTAQYK